MNFGKLKEKVGTPNPLPNEQPWRWLKLNPQQALASFQSHCSGLLHHFSHFQSSLSMLHNHATDALHASRISTANWVSSSSTKKAPVWARIGNEGQSQLASTQPAPMSMEDIEERLAGVPVYTLTSSEQEFVLVTGPETGKSLGLFCFSKQDAEKLLEEMRSMDPKMRTGSRVVAVALNKVFQLKHNGVAFRLIPELSQIENALDVREMGGLLHKSFTGVPVFQSRSLVLRTQEKNYKPVFFRKEDLENSLHKASKERRRLNPALRQGEIEVAGLEEIIKGMKENSDSKWQDVVFVPPGFDFSNDPPQEEQQ